MASKKSASFHQINSDYPLNRIHKYLYLASNFLISFIPSGWPKGLERIKFQPSSEEILRTANEEEFPISPSRLLSNTFWNSINWNYLQGILASEIRVAEIGCGSGRYGNRLQGLTPLDSYLGIDLFKNSAWETCTNENFSFVQASYEDFSHLVNSENFIITQSAIEHFDEDLKLFEDLNNFAENKTDPVVSIHIFPSAFCILTFLWHGIRQYGSFEIRRIIRRMPQASSKILFSLGGIHSNIFHLRRITFPSVFSNIPLTDHSRDNYFGPLMQELKKDSESDSRRFASFYALVLAWNIDGLDVNDLIKKERN
jgi:SAM-dependent methyltransferase